MLTRANFSRNLFCCAVSLMLTSGFSAMIEQPLDYSMQPGSSTVRTFPLVSADAAYAEYRLFFREGADKGANKKRRTLFRVEAVKADSSVVWLRWSYNDDRAFSVRKSNGTAVELRFDERGRFIAANEDENHIDIPVRYVWGAGYINYNLHFNGLGKKGTVVGNHKHIGTLDGSKSQPITKK